MFDLTDAVKELNMSHLKSMTLQTFKRILTLESENGIFV